MMVGNLVGGRYRIKKLLKQGGMGGVYIADDVRNPGVEWAVKVALPGAGDEARENFELAKQEAEFLKELNHTAHPNILWFQESIVTSEVQLVMELVKVTVLHTEHLFIQSWQLLKITPQMFSVILH